MLPTHPYSPSSAAIPGFVPNQSSLARLLPPFAILLGLIVVSAYRLASSRSQPRLRPIDRFAVAWCALSGFLHVFFEGYYIYHRSEIAGLQTTFAQLWKEYALSDSRYLTSDVFTVCIEVLTVFLWGPLSWLVLIGILAGSPSRHMGQVMLCTAHLYGLALYFATSWAHQLSTGLSHSRPEFRYFWIYYVAFNLPWAIVPAGKFALPPWACRPTFGPDFH